ncbi:MAG: hypothetical protein HFI81_09945 [Eubacterium sp.]|nr:hypothetical protein [Eubacterium sp.]
MNKERLTYEMILDKSKETGILFSNLLGGAILEEIVRRISQSGYSENLWLRNGNILGISQYEKNLILTLEYVYLIERLQKKNPNMTESMFFSDLLEELSKTVFLEQEERGICFAIKSKIQKKSMNLQVLAKLGDMQVPVTVKMYLMCDDDKIPKKETFAAMMFPMIQISYNAYPAEGYLAEKYIEIITKLELIQNIGAYYDIYYLLERESVDGRKVREYIEEKCAKLQIEKNRERLDLIDGYRSYSYMKKKWKVFLRSVNSKEPAWEIAVERFINFFEPIWQAILEDSAFFGDWMPDLNRFL